MLTKILGALVFLIASISEATEFKLGMLTRYGREPNGIELYMVPDGAKVPGATASFGYLLSLLDLSDDDLHIRILPGLTVEAKREVLEYFQLKMPDAVAVAKRSKGNMHNPAISPLAQAFAEAVRSTHYYKELIAGIEKVGFGNCKENYEKFEFADGVPDVAEMNLICRQLPK